MVATRFVNRRATLHKVSLKADWGDLYAELWIDDWLIDALPQGSNLKPWKDINKLVIRLVDWINENREGFEPHRHTRARGANAWIDSFIEGIERDKAHVNKQRRAKIAERLEGL